MLRKLLCILPLLVFMLAGPLLYAQEPARAGRPAEKVRARPKPKPPSEPVKGGLVPKRPVKPKSGISLKPPTLASHDKKISLAREPDTVDERKTESDRVERKDELHHGDVGCDLSKEANAKKKCEEEMEKARLKQSRPQ